MKIAANYQRGGQYYFVNKHALSCAILFGGATRVSLWSRRKDAGKDAHRVRLEIVRTKTEAAELQRKWKRRKMNFAKKLAAHVAAKVEEPAQ